MERIKSRFWVGIDLGTSNSAVFYVDQHDLTRQLHPFLIPQWIEAGELQARPLLPSHLYLLTPEEQHAERLRLPWTESPGLYAIGEWARRQHFLNPGRSVHSAKSWLCYHGLDPHSAFLPQSEIPELPRYSPVAVSTFYLQHIRDAWNAHWAAEHPEWRLETQTIVLTVPASFDEVARELTLEATQQAGFQQVSLLEEPQAAFYAWLAQHGETLKDWVAGGQERGVLVVDIGGGTADFSLMRIQPGSNADSAPLIERIAVSDHLLLGGDNMDLTLAAHIEAEWIQGGPRLAPRVWEMLVYQCRLAKEHLLNSEEENYTITVANPGSRLIGQTRSYQLTRSLATQILVEGFFPLVSWDSPPPVARVHGLRQLGLPYAQEPAMTRHLGAFLRRYLQEQHQPALFPEYVLFNGGMLAPRLLQQRLIEQLEAWRLQAQQEGIASTNPVQALESANLHWAVAQGAAYFQLARAGLGWKITGGSARSYYINLLLSGSLPQETGEGWLCLLPQQAPLETPLMISDFTFALRVNQPVQFRLLASVHRPHDPCGAVFRWTPEEWETHSLELPPIQTLIQVEKKYLPKKSQEIQVRLRAQLNEIGTLSLFCVAVEFPQEWKLQFRLRPPSEPLENRLSAAASEASETVSITEALPPKTEEALDYLRQWYGKKSRQGSPEEIRALSVYKQLEAILGLPREQWPVNFLRMLWEPLYEGMTRRVRSVNHELNWIKLAGFCLRPGFGYPGDEWRIKQLLEVFNQGPAFPQERSIEIEWWVFCRRVAGGLPASVQQKLFNQAQKRLREASQPVKNRPVPGKKTPTKAEPNSLSELWRMLSSLEHLPFQEKAILGQQLLTQIQQGKALASDGWCLARLGARMPVYGSPLNVVDPQTVTAWIQWLLQAPALPFQKDLPMILVQLAQFTDDRTRDLEASLRQEVLKFLAKFPETETQQARLLTPSVTSSGEPPLFSPTTSWLLGDSLPAGLRWQESSHS